MRITNEYPGLSRQKGFCQVKLLVTKEHWDRGMKASVGELDYSNVCVIAQAAGDAGIDVKRVNRVAVYLKEGAEHFRRYELSPNGADLVRVFDHAVNQGFSPPFIPNFPIEVDLGEIKEV